MNFSACPPLRELPSPLFILGAAHSGKSELARSALLDEPPTTVIGTARLTELDERVDLLKAARPQHWHTLDTGELLESFESALIGSQQVLVDSINLWLANFLLESWSKYDLKQQDARIELELRKLLAHFTSESRIVLVSSEIGAGITPPQELSRFFRQSLGRVNAAIAATSKSVVHVVAGIPVLMKRE